MFFILQSIGAKEFECDRPFELSVLSLVDNTHPTPAEFGEDLVVADCRADHDAQIVALPDYW